MKTTALILLALLPGLCFAKHSFYTEQYRAKLDRGEFHDDELKTVLFKILSEKHYRVEGKNDLLGCHHQESGFCYSQTSLGYKAARKHLFGNLHLREDEQGYYVQDVYCKKVIRRSKTRIGPMTIPNNNIINCEHTWPQSKFSRSFSKGLQKSDLHHLFPTDSQANSTRGNNPFSDVNGSPLQHDNCQSSRLGVSVYGSSADHFEPPKDHKGNVARALFYFAVRYKMQIRPSEEEALRRWHEDDPVDAEELERNQKIFELQKNRNPFIDYPELVARISDF